ncbi:MAG: phenylalanine--tRNA ligase subunit beta [Verrucomicrobia bacterium]|nr:MAG: phenylalanine--tRNA ligase subunit beta [Verrucomicrobiota bacterium]
MNVSWNWLNEHVDLSGKSVQELDDLLTFAGIEIEGIHLKGVSSDRVVVAQIMEAVQHPNADRLKVTQVDAGEGFLRQIVCGAQNYQVGDKVPCALPGAALPNGFTIGETKMRGVESKGMLCSGSEIGLADATNGLLILSGDPAVGTPLKSLFSSDVLLEVEVTPNRPDLLSHRGLAFELAALLHQPWKPLAIRDVSTVTNSEWIENDAAEACPFYSLTKISGVKVQESPDWLKERLLSIGLRPINNVVDITNFVLHELGQPLHAFDADQVGVRMHLRNARAGECFAALNGSEYALREQDLVISDDRGEALALAGVMGGLESGVTEKTTTILLESAYFTPSCIRSTSRAHQLSSDSSYRFERGVDPSGVLPAAARAVDLILQIAGGQVEGQTACLGELPVLTGVVELQTARLDQLMGGSIELAEAEEILTRLGLTSVGENLWQVPSRRADLQRHIDLVEEIARVHGLAKIPSRTRAAFVPASDVDAAADLDMGLRRALAALGFYEAQTIKLIAEKQLIDALPLRALQSGDVVKVRLPLSEDHAVLRPSLVPGLISTAERNVRQGVKSLRFFEMGRVFRHSGGGKARDLESESLALLISGPLAPDTWLSKPPIATVHDVKAVLQQILPNCPIRFTPREREGFVLACDVQAGESNIGVVARLRLARERELDFTDPVWVVELDLGKVRKWLGRRKEIQELAQFPGSTRDAAMELPVTTTAAQLDRVIEKLAQPLLEHFECFDVFTDPTGVKLAADRKSMAYRFHYRASDRTLKTEEVEAAHQMVLQALIQELGVQFR